MADREEAGALSEADGPPARVDVSLKQKLLLSIGSPLLFWALMELGLGLAGVELLIVEHDPFLGFSQALRVYEEVPERGVMRTKEHATRHSFASQEFAATKPPGGFRIFTLGGSSALGFPWGAEIAFTRLLGDALRHQWPDRPIEAVNAAAMSYASHRLRILAHELKTYEPDLFVIYGGHNEFVERRFYSDRLDRPAALDPLLLVLYRSRLYSAMARLLHRAPEESTDSRGPNNQGTGQLLGLDVTRKKEMYTLETERREVLVSFEENVRAVIDIAEDAGAKVVISTVPSNIRDWSPNQSVPDPGLSEEERNQALVFLSRGKAALGRKDAAEAARLLEQARDLSPKHAEVQFRLGRAYDALGRWDDARRALTAARDLDAQPSRAMTRINETLRRVAADRGIPLVDAERVFENEAPNGLVGFNLIEDYVHPNPKGHELVAYALYELLLREGLVGEQHQPDPTNFAKALEVSTAERDAAAGEGASVAKRAAMLYNLAFVLQSQGHRDEAIEKYRACLKLNPSYGAAHVNLGLQLAMAGKPEQALFHFERALAYTPDSQNARVARGRVLMSLDRDAVEVLKEATEHDPKDARAWDAYGMALITQAKDYPRAAAACRKALELEPRFAGAMSSLGRALVSAGQLAEGVTWFEKSLELRHGNTVTKLHYARALIRLERFDQARVTLRSVLAVEPDNTLANRAIDIINRRDPPTP
jgi:tetratricopeptide (TPR) repeat protein